MKKKIISIEDLEKKLYEFINKMLPTTSLYWVRFYGYTVQQDPLHADIIRRSQCYIKLNKLTNIKDYPEDIDNKPHTETEFSYSIILQQKRVNAVTINLHQEALKIIWYIERIREMSFFDYVGFSEARIVDFSVTAVKEESLFYCELSFKFNALIGYTDSFKKTVAKSMKIYYFNSNDNKKLYEKKLEQ